MKRFYFALMGISLFWLSCPQTPVPISTPTPEPFNGQSAHIMELFNPANYTGEGEALTTTNIISNSLRLKINSPTKASVNADAYLTITGTIDTTAEDNNSSTTSDIPWFLMKLQKGSNQAEETWYWLHGTQGINGVPFSQKVWLRFGKGTYNLTIYRMAEVIQNSMGVFSSWSYFTTPVVTLTIVNTNSEDGRYLYPSAVIQSDNSSILAVAAAFSAATPFDYIKNMHDDVVRDLYYDNDSLVFENRKPQDALYVLGHGLAVCEGYATYYAALLRARNIPAKFVSGLGNGGSHAWNKVSDGTQWKYVDTTWDDPLMKPNVVTDPHSDYPAGDNLRWTYFWENGWPDHSVDDESISRSISVSNTYPGYPDGSY